MIHFKEGETQYTCDHACQPHLLHLQAKLCGILWIMMLQWNGQGMFYQHQAIIKYKSLLHTLDGLLSTYWSNKANNGCLEISLDFDNGKILDDSLLDMVQPE